MRAKNGKRFRENEMVDLLCLSWRWQIREIKKVVHVSQAGILEKKDKRERKHNGFSFIFVPKFISQ